MNADSEWRKTMCNCTRMNVCSKISSRKIISIHSTDKRILILTSVRQENVLVRQFSGLGFRHICLHLTLSFRLLLLLCLLLHYLQIRSSSSIGDVNNVLPACIKNELPLVVLEALDKGQKTGSFGCPFIAEVVG